MNQGAVRGSQICRALVVGLVEIAVLLGLAVLPALAHATLVSASPAPGEVAPSTVKDINMTFDSLLAPGSTVMMFTGNFLPVPGIVAQVERGRDLAVHFEAPLPPGTYTVQWTAVTFDGHSVEGSYQFGVSKAAGASLSTIWVPITAGVMFILGAVLFGREWVAHRRMRQAQFDTRKS